MQCLKNRKHGCPEENFLFFFDSLVEVFQPTNEALWAFQARHNLLYEYFAEPFYRYREQALRAAKLHVLTNFCERSNQMHCLTLHPTDRVFVQSEADIAQFGNARDLPVIELYPNPQDRIELLKNLRLNGKVSHQALNVINLDGMHFQGRCTIQRIQIDQDCFLLLEHFKPFDVRC